MDQSWSWRCDKRFESIVSKLSRPSLSFFPPSPSPARKVLYGRQVAEDGRRGHQPSSISYGGQAPLDRQRKQILLCLYERSRERNTHCTLIFLSFANGLVAHSARVADVRTRDTWSEHLCWHLGTWSTRLFLVREFVVVIIIICDSIDI